MHPKFWIIKRLFICPILRYHSFAFFCIAIAFPTIARSYRQKAYSKGNISLSLLGARKSTKYCYLNKINERSIIKSIKCKKRIIHRTDTKNEAKKMYSDTRTKRWTSNIAITPKIISHFGYTNIIFVDWLYSIWECTLRNLANYLSA